MPDVTGLLLVASSWTPTLLSITSHTSSIKLVMVGMSALLTLLAIIDYLMKIHWKLGQKKRARIKEKHSTEDGRIDLEKLIKAIKQIEYEKNHESK